MNLDARRFLGNEKGGVPDGCSLFDLRHLVGMSCRGRIFPAKNYLLPKQRRGCLYAEFRRPGLGKFLE